MKQNILISVDDGHVERMPIVVEQLENAGLEVHDALRSIGTITGAVEPARIAALKAVDGVASVEAERAPSVPPPEAPIQ